MIEGGLDEQAEGFFTEGQGHGPFLEHLLGARPFPLSERDLVSPS